MKIRRPHPALHALALAALAATHPGLRAQTAQPGATTAASQSTPAQAAAAATVTISAQREGQLIQQLRDVPQSISAVGGVELERLGATNITDVLRRIGNVSFNYGNPRTGSLTLRGLSTGSNDTIDPSVGLVIDGVSLAYSPIANGANYIDIDSISVARGPQGTRGYKGASVGQIEVRNRLPSFTPEAEASITFGDWNNVRSTALFGGPVVEGLLAWRGSFLREQGDGYWANAFPDLKGRTSYVNTDRTYARVQFLLTPTPELQVRLSLEHQPRGGEYLNGLTFKKPQPTQYSDGTAIAATTINAAPENRLARGWFSQYGGFTPADYFANPVWVDNNGSIITGSRAATAEVDWKLGPFALKSITGWRDHWFSAANDEGTPFDVTKSGGFITSYEQVTQELRLAFRRNGTLDAVTGLYLISTHNDSLTRTRYGSDAGAWFATGTGAVGSGQYGVLANNANAALNAPGRNLLRDSLNAVYKGTDTFVKNKSLAWYGQADWTLAANTTLGTGLRVSQEKRRTSQFSLVLDNGFGAALNPVAVNNVELGGFASDATGALAASNTAAQLGLADQVANRYYGAAVTSTPGAAYNGLTAAQRAQVAAAKAVRSAQITGLYTLAVAEPYEGTIKTATVSLTQKLDAQLSVYGTVQAGEKAGISQINGSTVNGGISVPVRPEKTQALEIGLRGDWLAHTLTVNADVFVSDIKDFQQTVSYLDPVLTAINNGVPTYGSGPGNVAKVRVQGVEADVLYTGIAELTLRAAAAFNDAKYRDHRFSGIPSEQNPAGGSFRDVSGRNLPNAPRYQLTLGADWRHPWGAKYVAHANANVRATSGYNSDTNLSDYGWVKRYALADIGFGLGRQDGSFDVNVIAKNAFNKGYHPVGWTSYSPSAPRWVGVVFSGKI